MSFYWAEYSQTVNEIKHVVIIVIIRSLLTGWKVDDVVRSVVSCDCSTQWSIGKKNPTTFCKLISSLSLSLSLYPKKDQRFIWPMLLEVCLSNIHPHHHDDYEWEEACEAVILISSLICSHLWNVPWVWCAPIYGLRRECKAKLGRRKSDLGIGTNALRSKQVLSRGLRS